MLIPAGRKKILEVFLKDPFKEIHLRELSRLSKSSLANVDNSMRLFVKNDMFKRNEMSHSTFFKPNLENEDTIKIFELLELERRKIFYAKNKNIARLIKKYTDSIIELSNKRIQLVILFGSVARGKWTKGSDIDILAVVPDKESDIIDILNKAKTDASPLLEIRPISTTTKKFIDGFKAKTEFYDNLWNDRIVLYSEFLFWQLIREGGK
ncbi:MAG: nucleotidyltransferase domain-containing protein [Candidatus Omnitrophota bacterium]